MSAFYLDWLIPVLLVILVFVLEATRGYTFGKRLVGLRVQSLGGGLPSRAQAGKRLARFGYVLPYLLTYWGLIYFTQTGASITFLSYLMACGIGLTVLFFIQFAWAVRKGRLPFYDRWAGTEVVRLPIH